MNTPKTYRYGVSVFLLFMFFLSSPLFARGGGERDLDIRIIGSGEAGMTIRHMLGETTIPADPRRIGNTLVRTLSGDLIPLSQPVRFQAASGPGVIARENMRRFVLISCDVKDRKRSDVESDIRKALAPILNKMADGYLVKYGSR